MPSWSGRERNCVYLNCGNGHQRVTPFANVSAISGLDFPDDARGMAVVDWDQDGDLDVWMRNRNAPRLRFMNNQSQRPGESFISVRLIGTTSNRDAIGAVAELKLTASSGKRLLRTVTAGDAFLSQSSKILHFGLGQDQPSGELVVIWPGGAQETFFGLVKGQRYVIEQGTGKAKTWRRERETDLKLGERQPPAPTAAARIVMPTKIAMPTVDWMQQGATKKQLEVLPGKARAHLIVFWTSSCPNCIHEMTELNRSFGRIQQAKLNVVAINIDQNSIANAAQDNKMLPFDKLTILTTTDQTLSRLRDFQNAIFDSDPPFVVPFALLLDSEKNIAAIYRGAFGLDVILDDMQLTNQGNQTLRNLAVPFHGTWFTKPATKSQFAEFVGRRLYGNHPREGLRYYEIAVHTATDRNRQATLRNQVVATYHRAAKSAAKSGNKEEAIHAFQQAIRLSSVPTKPKLHHDFGVFYLMMEEMENAKLHFQSAIQLQPNFEPSKRALENLQRNE